MSRRSATHLPMFRMCTSTALSGLQPLISPSGPPREVRLPRHWVWEGSPAACAVREAVVGGGGS